MLTKREERNENDDTTRVYVSVCVCLRPLPSFAPSSLLSPLLPVSLLSLSALRPCPIFHIVDDCDFVPVPWRGADRFTKRIGVRMAEVEGKEKEKVKERGQKEGEEKERAEMVNSAHWTVAFYALDRPLL